jgi:hypothetical protein
MRTATMSDLGVVTLLKEEHENSAPRTFSSNRNCLAPHVHSRRAKGSVRALSYVDAPVWQEFFMSVRAIRSGAVICPAFVRGSYGRWP